MYRLERIVHSIAARANWVAMAAVLLMMTLIVLDVIGRFFRHPIPGTYDIVGLLGAVVISFSLAYTSVKKGHIAVEFLVQKLSERTQSIIETVTSFASALFFGMLTWRVFLYAADLKSGGEVSMTVKLPLYPFVAGAGIGCAFLTVVLCLGFLRNFNEASRK